MIDNDNSRFSFQISKFVSANVNVAVKPKKNNFFKSWKIIVFSKNLLNKWIPVV